MNQINIIPIIAAMALGVQKILPIMQELFSCWVGMLSFSSRVLTVVELLDKNIDLNNEKVKNFRFKNYIQIKSICFGYSNDKTTILKNISLNIDKGEKIGIIGSTGSGKSTLLDLIMGLQKPIKGKIIIDNKDINSPINKEILSSWQSSLALVPQNIFITNSSIFDNITFGVNEKFFNKKLVYECAKIAKLDELISKKGMDFNVGQYGQKISGGQRQRIAIARALYLNTSSLIFDEATSALDKKTEKLIIKNIMLSRPTSTIIMISHRLSILEEFDRIIYLKDGYLFASGNPKEIISLYNSQK